MNLLVGVSGGIAAYKACELCSLARKADHQVRVITTKGALQFVGAVTFEGLTGQRVMQGVFDHAMDHIDWAKWADVAVVAPATANVLGKIAQGLADDALTTTLLALGPDKPVVLGPAMNTEMWRHPAVVRNLELLATLGPYTIVDPVEKRLACGDYGPGALAEPADLLAAAVAAVTKRGR
jgi:phosphopantothenoylcysteine decarboxylase / phosphopantothenate---cysteine ligase